MKNKLRELRSKSSISQADMGRILNVSRQTINSIENGKYDPSLPLAFKIAEYFNLKIEDIFVPN
ncbi:MAG: helix-turn-helix transcriptional regulator [Gammaproteobacteria bacterium]|nr:helix-turn-helix transcriptional regulator [Gammaproteobacteria bacterium]